MIKDTDTIKKEIKNKTFEEEIEHGAKVSLDFLNKYPTTNNAKKTGIEIYKRALMLTGSGNLQILKNKEEPISTHENKIPNASYLAHGARIVVEIPSDSGDDLFNWLCSGNSQKKGRSDAQCSALKL
jgi:hypothetical protein